MMARMAQAAQGGEPVRDISPLSRANQTSRHLNISKSALTLFIVPARHFPQLKAVSVNKMPPNAPLDGAKPTGEPTVVPEPAAAPTHTPAPTDPGSSSAVPVKREANEPNAPPGSLRWSRGMPIPRTYEVILDAFVAVQQVHQFMRRRGKGGNTEELCAGVEEVTKRRCTLDTLRAIEAFRPGTLVLSVRPGANDDDGRAASDPTRVRVDFPDVNNGIKGGAKGVATNDAFRQILVDAVAARHVAFLRDLPNNEGDSWETRVQLKGCRDRVARGIRPGGCPVSSPVQCVAFVRGKLSRRSRRRPDVFWKRRETEEDGRDRDRTPQRLRQRHRVGPHELARDRRRR